MPLTVYNASNRHVLVRVTTDSISEKQREYGFGSLSKKSNDIYQQTAKSGFSMVQRHSQVEFFPEGTKETAYVSIKPTGDDNSMYMFLCEDLPVKRDGYGVIISEDFYLRNAKSAWVDTDGKSHDPNKNITKKTADKQKTADIPKDTEKTDDMPENNNKMYPEPSGIKYLRKNNSNVEEKILKREGIIVHGNAIMTLKDI